ncbi:PREDICTED: olfactory receptor 1L4-like [Nanorana parkeri]|uniref:olfactory receptor 1L4-like n=1 Tax=Nanorana parkeri TaxID=125878 RepID=UPI000854A7F7|nr:PREDICTED: olfactory receptor 1L4-like [Nanorana parkeri]
MASSILMLHDLSALCSDAVHFNPTGYAALCLLGNVVFNGSRDRQVGVRTDMRPNISFDLCKNRNETVHRATQHKTLHLLAFSIYPRVQIIISVIVLFMYILCILGNLLVAIIVCLTPRLHTPMYFFLGNLTFLDIVYVSVILPKLLAISMIGDTSISYPGCFTQIFFYVFSIGTEFFLLTSMAYDRYVAICIPLHYVMMMNRRTCLILAVFCCTIGTFNSLMYAVLISRLSFPSSSEINHFFCHMKSVLRISCNDSTSIAILITVDGIVLGFVTFMLILTSYMRIISTILKIHTTAGRLKAFSSCSSHITIVVLFCLTSLTLNMKPETEFSQEQDKILSMVYIAVVPMLNPLVYSLRNKDVLKAINELRK